MALDDQTASVVEMYSRYPFPSRGNYNDFFRVHVLPTIEELRRTTTLNRLLDAGCGTGNITADIAMALPDVEIVAADLTDPSLALAREKSQKLGLKNVSFVRSNLMEHDARLGTFDFVYCQGVIHHLTDPVRGLVNLNRYLGDDRHAFVWLYGLLGRANLVALREALRILDVCDRSWQEKMDLVRKARPFYLDERRGMLRKIINVLDRFDRKGLAGFGRYLRMHLMMKSEGTPEEIHIADQILHPQDKFYRFEEAVEQFEQAGFSFVKMLSGMSNSLSASFGTKDPFGSTRALTPVEAYRLIELHEKPEGMGFLIRKSASP